MGVTTFKVLIKDRPLANGLYRIRIRITRQKVHAYYSTGLDVKKTEFNEAGSERLQNWVKGHRLQGKYNTRLQEILDALRDLATADPQLGAKELKKRYEEGEQEDEEPRGLVDYWRVWIERKLQLGKAGTAVMYRTGLNTLLAYTGPTPEQELLLTPQFAVDYTAHLLGKGYKASTIRQALTVLSTVFKNAVEEGWLARRSDPFATVEVTPDIKKRLRPTHEQVMQLMELDLRRGTTEYNARNCFLLQYFLHGARISEVLTLKWSEVTEKRVEYRPKKRATRMKSVAMNPGLRWTLDRCSGFGPYVLPYLKLKDDKLQGEALHSRLNGANSRVGYGLKKLSELLELPFDLTSHMARHAFADKAMEEINDMRVVQALLGHASVVSTERYVADLQHDKLDNASAKVYNMWVA